MKRVQLRELAEKFITDQANIEEKNILHQQYDSNLIEGENIVNIDSQETEADLKQRIYQNIERNIIDLDNLSNPSKKTVEKNLNYRIRFAAAAIILISIGLGLYYFNGGEQRDHKTTFAKTNSPISPGTDKATLTLSNGTEIILNKSVKSESIKQKGAAITKTANGQLIYSAIDNKPTQLRINGEDVYNTVRTPRGGKYQVDLPDGTKVWLNAATSIRFPVSFKGSAYRSVTLNGEAYFEVTPNKNQPFIVSTASQTVKVLGTHFNVNNYDDDGINKTTLVEGSVRVSRNSDAKFSILKPGQQASLHENNFKIYEVDTDDAIAWKNGYFVFENDNLDGILKKLARWYDVKISYNGQLNNIKVIGSISRENTLEDVLKTLEKTEKFKFKLKERRITVM